MAGDALTNLLQDIRQCRLCIEKPQGSCLPHEPRPVVQAASDARLAIAGQAPGVRVHNTGVPFNDPSGDRLRDWMALDRETFYDKKRLAIVPMGFCFPGLDHKGGDLPPRKECAPQWRGPVFEQLPNIELVLVIGMYAQAWHLGKQRRKTLTQTVEAWREFTAADTRPAVLPLPHPSWRNNSWLRKNPWFEEDVLPYLRKEVHRLVS